MKGTNTYNGKEEEEGEKESKVELFLIDPILFFNIYDPPL